MSRENLRWTALTATITCMPALAGEGTKATSVHDFEMTSIDSESVKLSTYEGKVLLLVNVASK